MDAAYFAQLERLYMKAAPYMGASWRKAILDSLLALQKELMSLSQLAADNLESAVNAESTIKSLRDELAAMRAEKTEKTEVVIIEPVQASPEAPIEPAVVVVETTEAPPA